MASLHMILRTILVTIRTISLVTMGCTLSTIRTITGPQHHPLLVRGAPPPSLATESQIISGSSNNNSNSREEVKEEAKEDRQEVE